MARLLFVFALLVCGHASAQDAGDAYVSQSTQAWLVSMGPTGALVFGLFVLSRLATSLADALKTGLVVRVEVDLSPAARELLEPLAEVAQPRRRRAGDHP